MLNNKGQSLILFIVVLPILLLILILVVDVGKVIVLKQELDGINKIIIDYGLDNISSENLNNDLVDLVYLNNKNIDIVNMELNNDKLYVELKMNAEGVISGLIDMSIFEVNSAYLGYIKNGNKRIERVNGD